MSGLDLHQAETWLEALHGGAAGRVAVLVRRAGEKPRTLWSAPARPHRLPPSLPSWAWHAERCDLWASCASFGTASRKAEQALEVGACWLDADPPEDLEGAELAAWRSKLLAELRRFEVPPSFATCSGRGVHAFWKLRPRVRLEGPDRERLAGLVVAVNKRLAAALGGDSAWDLARVLRLPGTWSTKPGAVPGELLEVGGPAYLLEDLAHKLDASSSCEVARTERRARALRPAARVEPQELPGNRGRGRPALGVTLRDLRRVWPPWVQDLIKHGPFHVASHLERLDRTKGRSYRRAGGFDRSDADMCAAGAMVRAGLSDGQIVAAFKRETWACGWRFRELLEREGEGRALGYLVRTIQTAREGAPKVRSE